MYRLSEWAVLAMVVWWWSAVVSSEGNVVRNEDICGAQNGRRLYLELGEKGILFANNVSFVKKEPKQEGLRVYASNSSHAQCSLELVTCPSCVIIVTFQSITLPHYCGDASVTMDSPCRCDYIWISEPPYEDVSGSPFCGLYAPITYRSSTRTLSITLLYSESHKHAFTLEYTAERNRLHLRGTELTATGQAAKGLNNTGGGILTSPFFPARYPRDLGLEYVVTCPSETPSCRIRLLFSDFQLATVSIMEFYDWNGQRLDVSSGARFRPPVIMSSGPSLLIRFYANGGTGLGYKAFYSFVIGHAFDKSVQPITDCGGYVENLGGTITMMDMVDEGVKTYDCVWLIRPPKNFLHMKTHMYLKVVTFADMAGNTELIVKQGPTSALLPLEILRHPVSQVQPLRYREHVAPVTSGFHVSLRGTFASSSHLAIAYAAFSYMDCFAGSDFLCRNHRCIPNQLNCDGFDHCGDNSDEPATCFRDWEVDPRDRKWHVNKANYYFPKIDRYPDLKTATLVFVASSLGLIVLISALIILLYRMGARARQQRELQSRLQTISELLVWAVFDITDGARIDEISVSDDPPVYEAPPGYDEVIKLGLDSGGIITRKKRTTFGRESRSRGSPSCSSFDVSRSSICSINETASTSRGNRTTPVPNADFPKSRGCCLPDSPPPPYVTPPGTMPRNFSVPSPTVITSATEQPGDDQHLDDTSSREEEEARGTSLRDSFRRAGQFSLSFPRNVESVSPDADGRTTGLSIDAQLFGVYLRNCDASSSIRTADASCDSQPRNSLTASTDTELNCAAEREEQEGEPVNEEHREAAEEQRDQSRDEGKLRSADSLQASCTCEGACGCATVCRERELVAGNRLWPLRRVLANQHEGATEQAVEEQEDDCSTRSRTAIVRLFGTRTGRWQNGGSVVSTAASTPCGTFRRSSKKLSVYSRDGCIGRFSTLRSTSSYEKLSNSELEVARKSLMHASDPISISSANSQCRHARRYSSCDLESLCEGIRALDGFLSRRGLAVAHARKQSVTVMVFGTPEHGPIQPRVGFHHDNDPTDNVETIHQSACVSRFSLDALTN